ncbi:MAG: DUF4434 domain-containing protein [Planctomycetaceae bacterium]|jgi:hypothetical protein|nr:DUF4434 domain-containing protein [Planctomycetaceae bacterium]
MNKTSNNTSRREFLKQSTLSTIGIVGVTPYLFSSVQTFGEEMEKTPHRKTGFTSTFIDPYYYNWKNAESARQKIGLLLDAEKAADIKEIIVGWSAYYSNSGTTLAKILTAYNTDAAFHDRTFNNFLPIFLDEADKRGFRVIFGLLVDPDGFDDTKRFTSADWRDKYVAKSKALSDDLFSKFGARFDGWFIPCEPSNYHIKDPEIAYNIGVMIGQISDFLHENNGKKQVVIAPTMPTAIRSGITAEQFLDRMAPIFENAHADRWELQDGFMMTAWKPETIKRAFEKAALLAAAHSVELRAAMYTPVKTNDGKAYVDIVNMLRYVSAIQEAGVQVTAYQFHYFMDPNNAKADAEQMRSNYRAYLEYLGQ